MPCPDRKQEHEVVVRCPDEAPVMTAALARALLRLSPLVPCSRLNALTRHIEWHACSVLPNRSSRDQVRRVRREPAGRLPGSTKRGWRHAA